MSSLIRNLGSLVRMESSYSNEQDPWENEVPMSFQSTRRESRAKPPGPGRNPRAFTLPNLLSLRSHMRNRSNDSDYMPYSPALSRAPPLLSPRSVAAGRERVVDDHNVTEETSPAMMARSFTQPSNRTTGSPVDARGEIKNGNASSSQNIRNAQNGSGLGRRGNKQRAKSGVLRSMPPTSPVSDAVDEEERSPRRHWIRGRVRRVLRLGRRERPSM